MRPVAVRSSVTTSTVERNAVAGRGVVPRPVSFLLGRATENSDGKFWLVMHNGRQSASAQAIPPKVAH